MHVHPVQRAMMLAALPLVGCASEAAGTTPYAAAQLPMSPAGATAPALAAPSAGAAAAFATPSAAGRSSPSSATAGSAAGGRPALDSRSGSSAAGQAGSGGRSNSASASGSAALAGGGALAGAAGVAGAAADGGAAAAAGSGGGDTTCCPDGDCLCHGPAPTRLTAAAGPFKTARASIATGTLHYPTDAEPPFAAVALCGGFLNTGPEMDAWGPMYASHGIVTVIVSTDGADVPEIRATKLLAAIDELEGLQTDSASPLAGKLSGRYGTSGYSMGGGGTTLASAQNAMLKTSVGLAPWGGSGRGVSVPTLLLCGEADTVAACDMSQSLYAGIDESTPKMLVSIPGTTHFNWFGPTDAAGGVSGQYALAFQKVFLEGDTRWKPLLLEPPARGSQTTNLD